MVHAPALEVEYVATAGGGAARNDVPLPQRSSPALEKALVASGYSYEQSIRAHQADAVARMLPQVRDIRRIGSCALDLCAVADGSLDAYVEEGPHLWDHAAGGLIATECGGRIEVWPTPRGKELVAVRAAADVGRLRGPGPLLRLPVTHAPASGEWAHGKRGTRRVSPVLDGGHRRSGAVPGRAWEGVVWTGCAQSQRLVHNLRRRATWSSART